MSDSISYLIVGFVIGYFWQDIYDLAKKVWAESKKAKQEWRKYD